MVRAEYLLNVGQFIVIIWQRREDLVATHWNIWEMKTTVDQYSSAVHTWLCEVLPVNLILLNEWDTVHPWSSWSSFSVETYVC